VFLLGALWATPHEFRAKDISRGGVFIRTDSEPEIFSDINLAILLPWGGELRLRARIVHIMPPAKATPLGVDAGLGIEFQDPNPTEKEVIERLVIWARDSDPTRCVPKRVQPEVMPALNPMVSYVLEAIDGVRSVDEIADHLELEGTATESVLIQLADLGLVDLGGPESLERIAARAGLKPNQRPAAAPTPSQSPAPQECSLSPGERAAIEAIHARLAGDHYQVLAVLPRADREQIRTAYFSLSKQFHPDEYKAHTLGPYQSKLFDVFDRLTEAYATLSNPNSRGQYDGYLRATAGQPVDVSLPPQRQAPAPTSLNPSTASPATASPSIPTRPAVMPRVSGAPVVTSQVPPTVRYDTGAASRLPNASGQPPARPAVSAQPPPTSMQPVATSARAPAPRDALPRDEAQNDLVRSYLDQATKAFEGGDLKGSARLLDLLDALEWNRPQLRASFEELERKVYTGLASTFQQQAEYETKQQRWKQAARSWLKVCRGRPNDPECHRAAAEALLAQKADLRKAKDLAQRAVDLAPKDARTRRVLGHVFLEAGMHLNARRELEAAAALNRGDQETKVLLSKIPGHKP
jgi:curved DNA-binding protein CbpA